MAILKSSTVEGSLKVSGEMSAARILAEGGIVAGIDLYNWQGADYDLQVGQTATYDTGAATPASLALHIATAAKRVYQVLLLHVAPATVANVDIYIDPNNTTYAGQFQESGLTTASGTPPTIIASATASQASFWFDDLNGGASAPYVREMLFYVDNVAGSSIILHWGGGGITTAASGLQAMASTWTSATAWTSLGTIRVSGGGLTSLRAFVTRIA